MDALEARSVRLPARMWLRLRLAAEGRGMELDHVLALLLELGLAHASHPEEHGGSSVPM